MLGLSRLVERIENLKDLDSISQPVGTWVSKATEPDIIKNALSGTWLGHQLHPMSSDVPIGAWTMATALDVAGGEEMHKASQRLVGLGVLASVPVAASGASDWAESSPKAQRVGLVHAVGNSAGTSFQLASWIARRCGRHRLGAGLSMAGLASTMGAAYLGGHLSFDMGVGVAHTAFDEPTKKWTDVAANEDVTEGQLLRVTADDTPVMLTRHHGELRALSATCPHYGGPLDEGHIEGDCVVCPWHQSKFRLTDGKPERGPAAVVHQTWDVRTEGGRISVKASS